MLLRRAPALQGWPCGLWPLEVWPLWQDSESGSVNRQILGLLNQHFRSRRKYTFHEDQNIPLVIWSRGQPKVFCDVSEQDIPLKTGILIGRSRLQRLLLASERRLDAIRGVLENTWMGPEFYKRYLGVKLAKPRLVYPDIWSLVFASDGLWAASLPTGDPDFYDTLTIDPKWYKLLHWSHTRARKPRKRPTRLEKKLMKKKEYEQIQGGLL